MRTFIELKEISLKKQVVESSDFPENGFYKLHRKGEIESWDLVHVQKEFPHVMFIYPIDIFYTLKLEISEHEIICKYNETEAKTQEEKKHPALPNSAKADESLKFSQRKINNESLAPTAELISDGMVSADFVLEFTKILLSKK